MGGTLALYAQRGVQVYLLCGTLGEAGDVPDAQLLDKYGSVAALRKAELDEAAQQLGLAGVILMGYRDSGMPGSPDNFHPQALAAQTVGSVAAHVADAIRLLRPQVVLTFDSIGGYRHPDHIAIHRATVEGVKLAAEREYVRENPAYQVQKLYFNHFPKKWLRWTARIMPLVGKDPRRWGRNGDIDLVALAEEGDFPTHAKIDYSSVLKRKEAAAAAHASQLMGGPPRRGLLNWLMGRTPNVDYFMRAFPPPQPGVVETDLLAGVKLED